MTEFERMFGNEFFVIDSFNMDSIEEKFYGYAFQNGKILQKDDIAGEIKLEGNGAYIWVKVDEDKISIFQDFIGCYGLYLYKNDYYFAISNSFLKLVEHIKDLNKLTFNKKYADAFLFADLCSYAYEETLINEIKLLPRNAFPIIDKNEKTITIEEINLNEQTINIDSEEGMNILDKWYHDWVNLIRSIKTKTNNLTFDLSGGFDSRVVAALWLTSNIDLSKVYIHSYNDVVHEEDFNIASRIAKDFNFEMNNPNNLRLHKKPFEEINTPLSISFYTKLGFHKEMYFKFDRCKENLFKFTGDGGETIRGYYNEKPDEYIANLTEKMRNYDKKLLDSSLSVVKSSWKKLIEKFNVNENSSDLLEIHYKEVRNRHHFGKSQVESYFRNVITLAPSLDCNLRKIKLTNEQCKDRHLLIALIFLRYCPDLLNYKIQGNREIDQKTIDYAKNINNKYPLHYEKKSFISGPEIGDPINNSYSQYEKYVNFNEPSDLVKEVFNSESFKIEFMKHYSFETYLKIQNVLNTSYHFPLKHVYSALAILKSIYDTGYKRIESDKTCDIWLKSFINTHMAANINFDLYKLLLKYVTGRVDIKNIGNNENSIKIIDIDDKIAKVSRPRWLNGEDGNGIVIESIKGKLNLEIQCINEGTLRLWIRGPDVHDKNKNRFPVYIDYTKFTINGVEYINKNTLITHDKFFSITRDVKNLEKLNISIEWAPFNDLSEF